MTFTAVKQSTNSLGAQWAVTWQRELRVGGRGLYEVRSILGHNGYGAEGRGVRRAAVEEYSGKLPQFDTETQHLPTVP